MRRKAITAVLVIGFVGIVLLAVELVRPTLTPSLEGVSNGALWGSGTLLLNPFPWDLPRLSVQQAEQIALRQSPAATVRQVALAECMGQPALTPKLCWVISLTVSGEQSAGPPGSRVSSARYHLILVDARSGDVFQDVTGG
jgi:hypothetical protein